MALRWIGVADLERVRAWDDGDGGRATGTEMSAECGGAGTGLGSAPPRQGKTEDAVAVSGEEPPPPSRQLAQPLAVVLPKGAPCMPLAARLP